MTFLATSMSNSLQDATFHVEPALELEPTMTWTSSYLRVSSMRREDMDLGVLASTYLENHCFIQESEKPFHILKTGIGITRSSLPLMAPFSTSFRTWGLTGSSGLGDRTISIKKRFLYLRKRALSGSSLRQYLWKRHIDGKGFKEK